MKEYKRLTERVGKGISVKETATNDNKSIWNAIERLAELEDKIEQGKMLELPCKVGDTMYWLFASNIEQKIYECLVTDFTYNIKGLYICLSKKGLKGYFYVTPEDFGKTVFLTKTEAEQKLKELRGKYDI